MTYANKNQVIKSIKGQFAKMRCLPLFEFDLPNDEYLVVNLEMANKGIKFRFDSDNKSTHFSGDVIKTGDDVFLIKCDVYNTILDSYLEMIHDEITEGYLIPNDLYL